MTAIFRSVRPDRSARPLAAAMRAACVAAAAALVLAAGACDDGTSAPAATVSSLHDACIQLGAAWRASVKDCSALTFFNLDGNEGMDLSQTLDESRTSNQCVHAEAYATTSRDRGRLDIDLEALARCLDRVRAFTGCDGFATLFQSRGMFGMITPLNLCPEALRGTGGDGAACTATWECAAGLYCVDGADACSGTCIHRLPLGAKCRSGDECLEGTYCGNAERCAAFGTGAAGEPCTRHGCPTGFICDDDEAQEFHGTPTCRKLVPAGDPGAACSISGDDGKYRVCPAGTWCRLPYDQHEGTCDAYPGRGDACIEDVPCAPGLVCSKGTCGDGLPAGAPCPDKYDEPCLEIGYCDGIEPDARTCRVDYTVADGGSCSTGRDCASFACQDGRCVPLAEFMAQECRP